MSCYYSNPRVSGFSLLEVLAALAIFAMISATLVPMLYAAGRLSERTSATAEKSEYGKTSEALVRRLLEAAVIPGAKEREWRFDANSYLMRFLVVGEIYDGPALIEIRAVAQDTTQDLVVRVFALSELKLPEYEIALYEDYQNIEFSYFGDTSGLGVSAWQTNWLSPKLPSLVAIKLTPSAGKAINLEVAPLVTGAYFCDYDSTARTCRQSL